MDVLARFKVLIIDPATLVVFTAGFLLFMWGLAMYLWKLKDGGDTKTGVNHMIWGLVGMLVMVSVYGIIALIANTIGVDPINPVDPGRLQGIQPTSKFFPIFGQ